MTPLAFSPDVDPTTPGVMVDINNLIPNDRGYQDAPQLENLTNNPITDAGFFPQTAVMLFSPTYGEWRIFVGATTGIYERVATGWEKRFTAGASSYFPWSFRQFGSAVLATLPFITTIRTTSAPFFNTFNVITGAPRALALCVTTTHQVMALSTSIEERDSWWCSALGDHTNWTPSLATQAATGRLLSTPGPITGGIEFGPHIVAFKERSMYWMRYVNVPVVWATEVISNEVGAISNQSILDVGERILFVGPSDIYSFDGTRPVAIGAGVKRWFFDRLYRPYQDHIKGVYDETTGCAWWWYPTSDQDLRTNKNAIVLHVPSGRWGHASVEVGAPLVLRESDKTSATLWAQYDHGPSIIGAVMDGDLQAVRERTAEATIRLGWFGDDMTQSTLTKLRPRFLDAPPSATGTFYKTDDLDTEELSKISELVRGSFDTNQNANWHSAEMVLRAPFEVAGISHDIPRPAGKR